MLSLTSLFVCAQVAAEAAPDAGDGGWWKMGVAVLGGMLLTRLISWLADWLTGHGEEKIAAALAKAQEKINATSIGSQISADDAIIKILEQAIPDVLAVVSEKVKTDLKDGKLDKSEWEKIGNLLWEAAKPHIQGGANDYLKNSSFKDGAAIATLVAKRFFAKKEEGGKQ